jgi:hypothetical protein
VSKQWQKSSEENSVDSREIEGSAAVNTGKESNLNI